MEHNSDSAGAVPGPASLEADLPPPLARCLIVILSNSRDNHDKHSRHQRQPSAGLLQFGTLLAQTGWLPVLRTLGTRPWFGPRLAVSRAGSVFDADGNLTDERVREQVTAFIQGFSEFTQQGRKG